MKKIISVSLAVLCLVVLIFNIEVNQQKEAWALQFGTTTTQLAPLGMTYVSPAVGSKSWIVEVEGTLGSTTYLVRVIDANTTTTISTLNITSSLISGGAYSYDNIACSKGFGAGGNSNFCAISFNSGSKADRIVLFDPQNNVASGLSAGLNMSSNFLPAVAVNDPSGTTGTVYIANHNLGTNHLLMDTYAFNYSQSVSNPSNRLVFVTESDFGNTANAPVQTVLGQIPSGINVGTWVGVMTSGGTVYLYKGGSNAFPCTVNIGGGGGDIDFVNTGTVNNYWLASGLTTNIKKIDFGCNVLTTSDYSGSTSGQTIKGIGHSPSRSELYFESNSKVFVANLTSLSTTIFTSYTLSSDPNLFHNSVLSNDQFTAIGSGTNGLFVADTTNSLKIQYVYWGSIGKGSSGNGSPSQNTCNAQSGNPSDCVGQIDCSNPANVNLALCFINQNPKNNNGFSGTGGMLNSSVTTLSCSIGLIKCNFDANGNGTPLNSDVKTNGVGYLIAIIGLAILISIFWVASDHDLRNIPTFVWFIAVLGLLGAMVALSWLDPTFFIIAIIALVALGVAKVKSSLLGDF